MITPPPNPTSPEEVLDDCFERVEVTWDSIGDLSHRSLWTEVELVTALRDVIINHGPGYGLGILAWKKVKEN